MSERAKIAKCVGDNLRQARKRAGLSQEELAVRAGLHRTEIGVLERGGRLAGLDTAIKLAGALSISLNDLARGVNWAPGGVRAGGFGFSTAREKPR